MMTALNLIHLFKTIQKYVKSYRSKNKFWILPKKFSPDFLDKWQYPAVVSFVVIGQQLLHLESNHLYDSKVEIIILVFESM